MKVFKFGGASVKSAKAIKNVASIIRLYQGQELVVVFSAMGKTTNALENVVHAAYNHLPDINEKIDVVRKFHQDILDDLFRDEANPVHHLLDGLMQNIKEFTKHTGFSYDEFYDRIVSWGELISTAIISAWFDETGLKNILIPAPALIKTNDHYRDASVDWQKTCELIGKQIPAIFSQNPYHIIITQGFIASTKDGKRTTLGREGSDFTASVLAFCLNAERVVVWKDVEGLLNADPVYFKNTQKISKLSYRETIELAFYGAKVLHPKTIKPLQNKNIPLEIKSFYQPQEQGSIIQASEKSDCLLPFLILKKNQMLISFSARDFSFVTEDKLHRLFGVFHQLNIRINLMQNSAISFTVCINDAGEKLMEIIGELQHEFEILYNRGLELLTIRHFNDDLLKQHTSNCKIYMEQRSRSTLRVVYSREVQGEG
ncbi:MAG: aspartate kinase [Bacteroidales bacterium]|nr:aspartate kinase [Bacteroidales bacterium]